MRQIIDRILEGKFDYEKGNLDFSVARIELTIDPDTEYTGSFSVLSEPGIMTEGYVYSYDTRMKILSESFSGTGEEIGYVFSAKGLSEGDVVKGEVYIISNQGEYYLPYVVNISHNAMQTSMGSIKNLFHFTNLAKSDWDEAVKLFYSEGFSSLFTGNDRQYLKTYKGLSHYYGNEQNVEEFLLEINKKHPIEYIPERKEINISDPNDDVMETIAISRNGWGYTVLNVETDNSFIALSKTVVTDNDFLGNYLKYQIVIIRELLHEGNNYATIRFYNSFTSLEIKVCVQRGIVERTEVNRMVENERCMQELMNYYLAFRTRKISSDTWLAQSTKIVDRLQLMDEHNLTAMLYKAQILITEERYNEAKWLLDQAEGALHQKGDYTSAEWTYYLYLTSLHNREDSYVDEIADEIQNIYNMNPSEWRIAWFILYLSEEFAISPTRKWVFIESQLSSKCVSPVFYVEAVNMLIQNPALLTKLDNFEQRVLRYASRHDLMNEEIIRQFLYLVQSRNVYSDIVMEILTRIYDENPTQEVIDVICGLLIGADKKGTAFYKWYKAGVDSSSHVTGLYEYYMSSIDLSHDIKIPKTVLLYFSFHSDLDWQHNAYLLSRVILSKNEEPELFVAYKDEIDRFALEMIMKGKINRDLSVIYKYAINESVISKELACRLAPLIFTHRITVSNPNLVKVIIYQCHENAEYSYPIENGEAFVPIYTNDYSVMFEDSFSNRYMKSVSYDLEKLMVPGKLATMLFGYVDNNLEFDVYCCEISSEMVEITDANKERYRRIFDSEYIDEEYKTLIRSKLMRFYYDNDRIRDLDDLLYTLNPDEMNSKERVSCINYLVLRGFYDTALEWLTTYGTEGVDAKDVLKLCSKIIARGEPEKPQDVLNLCYFSFGKGKYDENTLSYLVENFKGMTKDNRKIFTAARDFNLDIFGMCEHAIIQMLYTGYFVSERMNIYRKYVEGGGDIDVRLAFISQCAYEFFVKEQLMESIVFEEITRLASSGRDLLLVCKLAYVKYFSEHKNDVDENILSIIHGYLDEFIGLNIYMSFFKEFMEQGVERINNLSDKTIIEYKTAPGRKVMLHYIIERDEESKGEYITREMREMYAGVHAKSFVLFFGENLLYYITEEQDGEEMLTQSGSISKSDIGRELSNSRFSEINDIVISRTLQDYDTAQNLIDEYYKKNFIVKNLFKLQ